MRAIALSLAAAALVAGAGVVSAKPRMSPEARLDKMLEGREAGTPRSCMPTSGAAQLEILDGVALVYRAGGTVWVNRPRNPESLDDDDILVTYPTGSQLCRMDRVHTVDRTSQFWTGFVQLGDFVPYRRVQTASR